MRSYFEFYELTICFFHPRVFERTGYFYVRKYDDDTFFVLKNLCAVLNIYSPQIKRKYGNLLGSLVFFVVP